MREMFSFRLVLVGPELDAHVLNRLWECGTDDAAFGEERGVKVADFGRSAVTFETAVLSAIRDIEGADVGLLTIRIEPDDLVTASGIADRTDRSRQNIAQLAAGLRGPGNFPPPLSTGMGKTRVWRWTDVQAWLARYEERPTPGPQRAHFVAAVNGALDLRRHACAFEAEGGSSAILASLQALVQCAPKSASVDPRTPVAGPSTPPVTSERHWDWDACRRSLYDDVRRTQSHCVFLVTNIVSELSQELSTRDPFIAEWVRDAASAHSRSAEVRLKGNVCAARALDREVAANAARILQASRFAGPRGHAAKIVMLGDGAQSGRDRVCKFSHHSALDWPALERFLCGISSLGGDRTPHREQVVKEIADALCEYDAVGHTDRSRYCTGCAALATRNSDINEICWQHVACDDTRYYLRGEWLVALTFDKPADKSALLPIWVAAVEESRVLLSISAWTLASTIGLLVQRYLPRHTLAVDDVISRIERDLASCSI